MVRGTLVETSWHFVQRMILTIRGVRCGSWKREWFLVLWVSSAWIPVDNLHDIIIFLFYILSIAYYLDKNDIKLCSPLTWWIFLVNQARQSIDSRYWILFDKHWFISRTILRNDYVWPWCVRGTRAIYYTDFSKGLHILFTYTTSGHTSPRQ